MKILVVRKISALEYHYNSSHASKELFESHNEQVENIEKIERILNDANQEYKTVTRKELSEKLVNKYDIVISAGGDGTVIAAAAFNREKPQLNLKTDKKSRGILCSENIETSLKALINEEYKTEKWTRQDVYLDGEFIGRALNETCIGENLEIDKMTRYKLCSPNEKEIQKNSGLVVVTGTGSGGWPGAFSNYQKDSDILKFRAIFPCSGIEKWEGNFLQIEYKGHEGKFSLDTIEYDFPRDSTLEIKISKYPLLAIVPKF